MVTYINTAHKDMYISDGNIHTYSSQSYERCNAFLRVPRKVVGPKRDEVTGSGENYTTRSLLISTAHQISLSC